MPRTANRNLPVALLALWLGLGSIAPLAACDIPVCEYALLHWPRQDYVLYYLHDGTEAPADAETNELLRQVAAGQAGHANLRFTSVNTALGPESLTPDARYVLKTHGELARPRHMLISPKGRTVFSGRITAGDIRDLLASPKTAALADMLSRGVRGVLLVMTDSDEAQNAAALEIAQGVIDAAQDAKVRMGLLAVSRQDPRELWLVRQLLAVEGDLGGRSGPMVFGAYGRCHVTEPYLGKGINPTNLTELAGFMNGPCTCDIKAANLGADLVSNLAWDAQVSRTGTPPWPMAPAGYMTFGE